MKDYTNRVAAEGAGKQMEELRGDRAVAKEVGFLRRDFPRRSAEEQETWSRLGVLLLATLVEGPAEKVRDLERTLREGSPDPEARIPEDPEEMTNEVLRRLEIENVLRVLGHYREVEERSIPARELREKLGVSREQMSRLRAQGRLLGILLPFRQSYYYPAWQFDPESGETFEGLPELYRDCRRSRDGLFSARRFYDPEGRGASLRTLRGGAGRSRMGLCHPPGRARHRLLN